MCLLCNLIIIFIKMTSIFPVSEMSYFFSDSSSSWPHHELILLFEAGLFEQAFSSAPSARLSNFSANSSNLESSSITGHSTMSSDSLKSFQLALFKFLSSVFLGSKKPPEKEIYLWSENCSMIVHIYSVPLLPDRPVNQRHDCSRLLKL